MGGAQMMNTDIVSGQEWSCGCNANDNPSVFSVSHYHVYYIGTILTKRCKSRLMGLKTAIQRVFFFSQQFGVIRAFPSILYLISCPKDLLGHALRIGTF